MSRSPVVRDYAGVSAADRRADRRARLMAAGRDLWGSGGPAGVTVRGVCAQAGLTPRYFYEHFPGRDELLAAIYDAVVEQMVAALVGAAGDETAGLEDRLTAALTALLELIVADPAVHRIVTSGPDQVPGLADRRARLIGTVTDLVVAYAPQVVRGPLPGPAQLRRRALFIVGGVDQIIAAWLADPAGEPAQLAAECARLCVAVVAGLA